MPNKLRASRIIHTAAAVTAAVCISLSGCTGCSQSKSGTTADQPAEAPAVSTPPSAPVHDPQMLQQFAIAIDTDANINEADINYMIALCEGSLQQLGQIADNLQRNEDAADSYNVLSELSEAPWTDHLATVVLFIHRLQLPANMQMRADAVFSQSARISSQIQAIEDSQLHGRRVFAFMSNHM